MSHGLKSAAMRHLLRHFRTHKQALVFECSLKPLGTNELRRVTLSLGALDCLYWQALGNGESNLAKGIRRLVVKSYANHPIRLAFAASEVQDTTAKKEAA